MNHTSTRSSDSVAMNDVWQFQILGGLRVERAGQVITRFRTQKTGLVLTLLALRGTQSRETLCALLWPDAPSESARSSLSTALSDLRRELGEGTLISDRHSISLAPGALQTDLKAFDRALKERDYATAIEIYRGHLPPAFHEDPLPSIAREYEEKARAAFATRLDELESAHDGEALRSLARRAALLFGDDERWFLALMRAHQLTGDLEAALRAYEALGRFVRKNGDVTSDTARTLAKAIRRERENSVPHSSTPQKSAARDVNAPQGASANPPSPTQTVSSPASQLPAQWTRFFGREAESDTLRHWLQSESKLVTISGTGGSGKTRLAIETLNTLDQGEGVATYFVPLAPLSDPELLFHSIRDALGIQAAPDLAPLDQLERTLRGQPVLLLLDNFEQLVEGGAARLQSLRERLPNATFLVTSRVLLHLPGEREFPLAPLPTPLRNTSAGQISQCASAALFCDRADLSLDDNNAEAIGALCRRLDGIPLALELAAARAKVLSPPQILERLEKHPDFLQSRELGIPARHKTLRATIEWSVDLLPSEVRTFFCRLCVFRGGFTIEAAESVCTPGVCQEWEAIDLLEQLRSHSLLQTIETETGTRYRLLEMLREWAQGHVDEEETFALRSRHFEFYLQKAHSTVDFSVLLARQLELEAENPNFRAALGFALEHENPNRMAQLVSSLCGFWEMRAHFAEGCGWARRALEKADELDVAVRAALQRGAGSLFWYGGNLREARDTLEASVQLYKQLDDEAGLAYALDMLGKAQMVRGQCEKGRINGEKAVAIARQRGDVVRLASSLVTQAWGLTNTRRPLESNACLEEALGIAQLLSEPRLRAVCLGSRALNYWGAGDEAQARAQCASLLQEAEKSGAYGHGFARGVVSIVACGLNDWEMARPILPSVARDLFSMGTRWEFINLFFLVARFALVRGDLEKASLIYSAAYTRCESNSYILVPCLHEFDLTPEELELLRAPGRAEFDWARGALLSDGDIVALVEEMCRE